MGYLLIVYQPYGAGPFDPVSNQELFAGFPNVNYYFEARESNNSYGPFTYKWTLTPPNSDPIRIFTGQSPTINFPQVGNYTLSLKKQSATCGSVTVTRTIVIIPNYGGFIVSTNPNPATTGVEVSYEEYDSTSGNSASKTATRILPVTISIYNVQGVTVLQINGVTERNYRLDVSTLPNGMYIIEVINQKGIKGLKRLVVQR